MGWWGTTRRWLSADDKEKCFTKHRSSLKLDFSFNLVEIEIFFWLIRKSLSLLIVD